MVVVTPQLLQTLGVNVSAPTPTQPNYNAEMYHSMNNGNVNVQRQFMMRQKQQQQNYDYEEEPYDDGQYDGQYDEQYDNDGYNDYQNDEYNNSYDNEREVFSHSRMGYSQNIVDGDLLDYETSDRYGENDFENRQFYAGNGTPVGDWWTMENLLGDIGSPKGSYVQNDVFGTFRQPTSSDDFLGISGDYFTIPERHEDSEYYGYANVTPQMMFGRFNAPSVTLFGEQTAPKDEDVVMDAEISTSKKETPSANNESFTSKLKNIAQNAAEKRFTQIVDPDARAQARQQRADSKREKLETKKVELETKKKNLDLKKDIKNLKDEISGKTTKVVSEDGTPVKRRSAWSIAFSGGSSSDAMNDDGVEIGVRAGNNPLSNSGEFGEIGSGGDYNSIIGGTSIQTDDSSSSNTNHMDIFGNLSGETDPIGFGHMGQEKHSYSDFFGNLGTHQSNSNSTEDVFGSFGGNRENPQLGGNLQPNGNNFNDVFGFRTVRNNSIPVSKPYSRGQNTHQHQIRNQQIQQVYQQPQVQQYVQRKPITQPITDFLNSNASYTQNFANESDGYFDINNNMLNVMGFGDVYSNVGVNAPNGVSSRPYGQQTKTLRVSSQGGNKKTLKAKKVAPKTKKTSSKKTTNAVKKTVPKKLTTKQTSKKSTVKKTTKKPVVKKTTNKQTKPQDGFWGLIW